MTEKSIIERALELARTGDFLTLSQIKPVLTQEGFTHVHEHFLGLALRREIKTACHLARGLAPKRHGSRQKKSKPGDKSPRSMRGLLI